MFDLSKNVLSKILIVAGLFLIIISFFLPYASGEVQLEVFDFSFWGTVNLLFVYIVLVCLFVLFFAIRKI
ncbi:MAG: hypothetical protein PHV27_10800, partial [Mesotoga sp.]